jgi:hypothetical protein
MTIFAMHKRTFTRAAGVSPPWLGNTDGVLQKWIIAGNNRTLEQQCPPSARCGLQTASAVAMR